MRIPLLVSWILQNAAKHSGHVEVVSYAANGERHIYTYRDCERRARKLVRALHALGVEPGDRVGTLAYNGYRHLEIYYGAAGMGAVVHTINPRLFIEQIAYIVNHADDKILFFDLECEDIVRQLATMCPRVEHWIALSDTAPTSPHAQVVTYDTLIDYDASDPDDAWPAFDEEAASGLCYTSGTTGNPKGILYSHRSTVLHAFSSALPNALSCASTDVILPVVPMFHVNAWGLPYSAPLVGAKLVLPGMRLDGKSLFEVVEAEQVTLMAGVPTVWQGLFDYMTRHGYRFSVPCRIVVGGAACPSHLIAGFAALNARVVHAWGMTELSPIGTVCQLPEVDDLPDPSRLSLLRKQGRPVSGIALKIVDDKGAALPNDGVSCGELHVRGPWVSERYFGVDETALVDGWFPTGDIATIDLDGYMQITDRSKDIIKSGGEWISSSEIENLVSAHPGVERAACIARSDPRWGERPLLVVQAKAQSSLSRDDVIAQLVGKIARWWMPDDVVFVDAIPLTATGKIHKLKLRQIFG
ncbi:long-chain-fatty-acid--CoA ligase [Burkholderia metallica]|nr:long-chain-fatty-acid--CoA ligase [Burkholderia metallica]